MKKSTKQPFIAKTLTKAVENTLSSAANSRCVFVFHQPAQPKELKKFRKF